ncbi:MAG TPA: YtxH domain-containing protein [Gemmatimonadaceae bacterium]|jgi:hypothetical protein
MDTIQDTPEETYDGRKRTAWRSGPVLKSPAKPRGRPFSRETDWRVAALIGAGVAAGAVLGAGIALLMAPQSGAHTRLSLSREMRRRRPWHSSPWEQLGDELRKATRRRNARRDGMSREDI